MSRFNDSKHFFKHLAALALQGEPRRFAAASFSCLQLQISFVVRNGSAMSFVVITGLTVLIDPCLEDEARFEGLIELTKEIA